MKPEIMDVPVPYGFSTRELAQRTTEGIYQERLELGELERKKLHKINEVLRHPELQAFIDEGKITFGVIKPQAYAGRNLPEDDDEAARILMDEIGDENIVFSFPTILTEQQVEQFYGDVKEKYQAIVEQGRSVWDSISEFAQSGPLTFMLIYREDGDAITWWREKMGKTRPNEASPSSIRGKYALQENLPNNLTHGSDSVESVKKEVNILGGIVAGITDKVDRISKCFPSTEKLQDLGFIDQGEQVVTIERVFDSGMRDESWIYGYRVDYIDANGEVRSKYLKEKNIISMGGALAEKAQAHANAFAYLESLGIPIPKTYGVRGATLYQDMIVNDQTQDALLRIDGPEFNPDNMGILDQLIAIASKLDQAGYLTINFLNDLIYDGDKGQFYYIDAGFDLGSPGEMQTIKSLSTLIDRFPRHAGYIKMNYSRNILSDSYSS